MTTTPTTTRSRFVKATRKRAYLRMAIDGPSGSGKSFTALHIASCMAKALGLRMAVIQSELGAAEKYQGLAPDGIPFEFDILDLNDYAPTEYTAAIHEAAAAGYGVLLIDSLSHAWAGDGGALDIKDRSDDRNSFAAWRNVTPMHNRMIDAIMQTPMHVLATMRSKTEWVVETDDKGKQVPRKIGLAPVQRAGMEYEFDVYASINHTHVMTVSKSRCFSIQDLIMSKPGAALANKLVDWVTTGETPGLPAGAIRREVVDESTVQRLLALENQLGNGSANGNVAELLSKSYGVSTFRDLTQPQAEDLAAKFERDITLETKKAAARRRIAGGDNPHPTEAGKEPVVTMTTTGTEPAGTKPVGTPASEVASDGAPPPVVVASTSAPTSGMITDEQMKKLRELRGMAITAMGWTESLHAAEIKAWWLGYLKMFAGVDTARGLSFEKAAFLIKQMEGRYDLPLPKAEDATPAPEKKKRGRPAKEASASVSGSSASPPSSGNPSAT